MPIGTIQEGSNRAHLGFWASHLNFLAIQQQQGPHQNLVNTLGEHHATANVLQIRHGLGLNSATETVKLLLLPLVLLLQQPTQD